MKTILFFSKAPMNYVMFRPVAEQLMQDARIRFLFHLEFERGQNPNGVYDPLGVRRSQIVPGVTVRWTNYDLYMSADYRVSAKRAKRKVHTFHGISFKGKAYVEHIKNYDDAFLIGPYQKKQFIKRGILAEDDSRFVEVGMPKLDPLVNGTFDRAEVLSRVGADPSKPVVLYAPTWRRESSLNLMGEEILRTVGAMPNVTLLLKVHDLCLNPNINARDWAAWLAAEQAKGAPWKVIRDWDVTPYLAIADLLISDASSVSNEFLLRDRPIIFMDVPELIEKYGEYIDLETWGRKTGIVVVDPAQLPKRIEEQLANPGEYSDIRRAAAADYFYNPGNATAASLKATYRSLELTPP